MVCPFCLHPKTHVYNSRATTHLNLTWRRRQCLACKRQFTTREAADPATILAITRHGKREGFSHNSLILSLLKACDHRQDADEAATYLAETIEQQLYRFTATSQTRLLGIDHVIDTAAETLRLYDPIAHVKYVGRYKPGASTVNLRRALKSPD